MDKSELIKDCLRDTINSIPDNFSYQIQPIINQSARGRRETMPTKIK